MIPIIMSGGSGTRLWPLSRKNKPKQFLRLFDEYSLFQNTLKRLAGVDELASPIVVCNEEHRFMVAEQLQEIAVEKSTILLEPCAKNTAPAIAVAAMHALSQDQDPILLVLAADHLIHDKAAFHRAISLAEEQAQEGKLVTFGIVPTSPHTGYGYIQSQSESGVGAVNAFVEKPDLETAQSYLDAGCYYWNSGMFMFKASAIINELQRYAPEMLAACKASLSNAREDLDFTRLEKSYFESAPSDSIDYAVMEKTDNAVVVPLDAGWSDVGSWSSLWQSHEKDSEGNVLVGDVVVDDVSNAYVHSSGRLVTLLGIDDVVVVDTDDVIMVSAKSRAEEIKGIVSDLVTKERSEATLHRKGYRPWGYYDSVDNGQRFQVKRLHVNPGQSLSLQKHYHRAEHWVVVAGCAEVTRDDEVFTVSENESIYIPVGSLHRLHNPGRIPLEIIEVQSGEYLGEDDIVRFDDRYNREQSNN